ncbi:uncharacterized protein LACBIDRAFT_291897, partial [Laccaria bicolor S238N-H82]
MSTPLQQPTLLDSCDTTLRARRPSSLNLLTAVLPCFTANPSSPDDFNPSDDTPLNDTPLGQGLSQKSMCKDVCDGASQFFLHISCDGGEASFSILASNSILSGNLSNWYSLMFNTYNDEHLAKLVKDHPPKPAARGDVCITASA